MKYKLKKIKKQTITKISAVALVLLFLSANMVAINSNSIEPLIGDFYADKMVADVNEDITFYFSPNNISFAAISYYVIMFHDDTLPIEILPDKTSITHSFKNEGKYMVTLIGVALSGLTDTKTCEVEIINSAPIIESVNIPDVAYEDEIVDLSVGSISDSDIDITELTYSWNLGDGNVKPGNFITHLWREKGLYPITLTVMDDQGAIDQYSHTLEIKNVVPIANFNISKICDNCSYVISIDEDGALVHEGCPLFFNAYLSYDSPSDINRTLYYWDFGDGQLERGMQAGYIFTTSGEYNVTLTVVDDNGDRDTASKTITVINEMPEIEILTKNITLKEGDTFVFMVNSSDSISDFMRLNYNWSFGKEGWVASNMFTDDFNGTVTVSVEDPEGLVNTDSTHVFVENVDPHINIDWAFVEMNLTMEIYGPTSKYANFSLEIIENNETIGVFGASKPDDKNYYKTPDPLPFFMDLSCNYTFIINRTHELAPATYWVYLTAEFRDGNSLTFWKSFNEFWPGWKMCPNNWVINPENYIFDMPVTFEGYVYDPGADDIHVKADLKIDILLEINFTLSHLFPFPEYYCDYICDGKLIQMSIYKIGEIIYVDINITETLIDEIYINEDGLPQEIYLDPTFYPVDLSFLEILELLSITDLLDIKVLKALNILEINVTDDDGGEDFKDFKVDTYTGQVEILNLNPCVFVFTYENVTEDNPLPVLVEVIDFNGDNVSISLDFGDGSPPINYPQNTSYAYHIYENEGLYLITASVFDGIVTTKTMCLIEVLNQVPEVSIQQLLNVSQDIDVELGDKFEYTDSGSDVESLRFYWEFGDGMFSPYLNVSHKWCQSGLMELKLHVIDDNGADGIFTRILNITNFDPVIEGPFGFEGAEGYALTLEMGIFDNYGDEINLNYTWNITGQIINEPRPTLFLDDGKYTAYLRVADGNGAVSCANISLIIEDLAPTVTITSKFIYGKPGEISLKAYAMDSYIDTDHLIFNWNINNETCHQQIGGYCSEFIYSYDSTSIITGQVEVIDDAGKIGHMLFRLTILIDTDGDGLSDEFEAEQNYSPDSDDTDGDYITDWYEIYVYGTNPADPDTDDDGLPDGYGIVDGILCGELFIGTDPKVSDTDNDNLTDGVEFFGWIISIQWYDPETEERINRTYWTNSDPLFIDTDNDLLFDDEEFINGTDPRVKDTDNDGYLDFWDWDKTRYDGDGDGLSDLKELEIGTDPSKADTDDDGLSDGEEYYPGQDGYKTDPNDSDSDDDGLLDGEELYTASKSLETRKKINNGTNEYSIYLYEGIRMFAASVTISISVGELSKALANLTVGLKVQGKPLFQNEYKNQRYFANVTNVKDLVDTRVGRYGGKWLLTITSDLECVLEEFTVEITKYLNPNDPDFDDDGLLDGQELDPYLNDGWITDPTKYDTDGDSISDKIEVNNGWNPHSIDTDGDGIEDWRDIDPLANVILQVKVEKGFYDVPIPFTPDPNLQVTLEIYTDTEHKYEIVTPDEEADGDEKQFKMPWLEWRWVAHKAYYYSCKWSWSKRRWTCSRKYYYYYLLEPHWTTITYDTVKRSSDFGQKYYVDINEKENNILIKAQLWLEIPGGWMPVSYGVYNYKVMDGTSTNKVDDKKLYNIYGGSNYVMLDIETKRVDRINTIAIHESNDDFDDHYSRPEKMIAVMLDVKDGSNSYFDKGFNAILIPTSIFADTKLHGLIENCVDENGNIVNEEWDKINDPYSPYSAIKNAEVSGIDRIDLKNDISPNVDCVITKEVSLDQAMQILRKLILTGANESEGEIYIWFRTSNPEQLGLAPDVLAFIPLLAAQYENDEFGDWPKTPWENFIELCNAIVEFIINVFIAVLTFFAELFDAIVEIGMCIAQAVIEAIMAFIEMLFKAIILAFIYLMFALTLVYFLAMFGIMIAIFSLAAALIGANLIIKADSLKLQKNDKFFAFEYSIGLDHYDLLDLEIPTIFSTYESNFFVFENKENYAESAGFIPIGIISSIIQGIAPLSSGGSSGNSSTSGNSNLKTAEINIVDEILDPASDFWEGFFLSGDLISTFGGVIGVIALGVPGKYQVGVLVASIIPLIGGFIVFFFNAFTNMDSISIAFIIGFLVGPILGYLLTYKIAKYLSTIKEVEVTGIDPKDTIGILDIIDFAIVVFGVIAFVIEILNLYYTVELITDINAFLDNFLLNIALYAIGIVIGGVGMGIDEDYKLLNLIFTSCTIGIFAFGLVLLIVNLVF